MANQNDRGNQGGNEGSSNRGFAWMDEERQRQISAGTVVRRTAAAMRTSSGRK